MESETLFVEEAEPPGRLTGSVGLKQYNDLFGTSLNTFQPPAVFPAGPVPRLAALINSQARAFL